MLSTHTIIITIKYNIMITCIDTYQEWESVISKIWIGCPLVFQEFHRDVVESYLKSFFRLPPGSPTMCAPGKSSVGLDDSHLTWRINMTIERFFKLECCSLYLWSIGYNRVFFSWHSVESAVKWRRTQHLCITTL